MTRYTEKSIFVVKSSASSSKPRLGALLLIGLVLVGGAWLVRPRLEQMQLKSLLKNASLPQLETMANGDPDNADVLTELGRRLVRAGQTQRGSLALMRVSQLRPDDAEVWNDLGYCMVTLNHEAEARASFDRALQISKRSGTAAQRALLGLGRLEVSRGRDKQAMESLRAAVKLDPGDDEALMTLGRAATRLALHAEAATAFESVTKLRPNNHAAFLALGQALVDLGRSEEGETALQRALQITPRDYQTLHALGVLFLRRDDGPDSLKKAADFFKQALKASPRAALTYSMLGSAEEKLGLLPQAALHLETSRRLDPSSTRVYYRLSQVYERLGRRADAARMTAQFTRRRRLLDEDFTLSRRLAATPRPPLTGMLRLAEVNFQLNNYGKALTHLDGAAKMYPGNDTIFHAYLALANSLQKLGQRELAHQAEQHASLFASQTAQPTAQAALPGNTP